MKNLIYFIFAITLLSVMSCTKNDDSNVKPIIVKTDSISHPEYLGKWICDSVYTNGWNDHLYKGYNFEFKDTTCIRSNDNLNIVYAKWKINNDTLSLTIANVFYSATLILNEKVHTYYLSKHK